MEGYWTASLVKPFQVHGFLQNLMNICILWIILQGEERERETDRPEISAVNALVTI